MNGERAGAQRSGGNEAVRATSRLSRDLLAAALIVAAALVLGLLQNSVSADPLPLVHQSTPAVAVIDSAPAVRDQASAGAVVIDARSAEDYAAGHIAAALDLPFADREKLAERFVRAVPSSSHVIVYCDTGCDAAARLAGWLVAEGWTDVAVFPDGISAWRSAGLPVSSGTRP